MRSAALMFGRGTFRARARARRRVVRTNVRSCRTTARQLPASRRSEPCCTSSSPVMHRRCSPSSATPTPRAEGFRATSSASWPRICGAASSRMASRACAVGAVTTSSWSRSAASGVESVRAAPRDSWQTPPRIWSIARCRARHTDSGCSPSQTAAPRARAGSGVDELDRRPRRSRDRAGGRGAWRASAGSARRGPGR